jgi:DNA polymerase
LGLPENVAKYKEGKRLVQKFCKPRNVAKSNPVKRFTKETSPDEWWEFKEVYLPMDCYSMREIDRMLPDLTDYEEQVWRETTMINYHGVPIDVDSAIIIDNKIDEFIDDETTKCIRITGLWPTQLEKMKNWCAEQGCPMDNFQKETVANAINDEETPEVVKAALRTRANTANVSLKKYKAIARTVCKDGTVKGTLFYHAGITGRWGGRLLQVHNLPRGTIDAIEAILFLLQDGQFSIAAAVSAIRGLIACEEGVQIYDWAQIEARLVQWLCGDKEALAVFSGPLDPYTVFGSEVIYNKPYDDITSTERFLSKQAILGLGYEMWANKFELVLAGYGITDISMRELKRIVMAYRKKHEILVRFWGLIQKGAHIAMSRPGQLIRVNKRVAFTLDGRFLRMHLPSGRDLSYCDPEIRLGSRGPELSYMGINDQSQWVRMVTYGGKLTENATQAIARDILAEAVSRCLEQGISILFHLHDEIIFRGHTDPEILEPLLTQSPAWGTDIPLDVEGEWSPRYRKI